MSAKKVVALALILIGLGIVVAFGILSFVNSRKPTAGLKVETTPESLVFVDNVQIGKTPLEKTFRPGEVSIKIIPNSTTESFPTYQTKVRLTDKVYTVISRDFGKTDSASAGETVTLQPQSGQTASLAIITSTPDSASVTLDGQPQGFTPLLVSSIPVGDHQITVSAPGFTSRDISAQALAGYKLTLNVKLAQAGDEEVSPTPTLSPDISASPSATPKTTPKLTPTPTPKVTPSPKLTPSPALAKPYVTILDTPTGFLRVRSGPGRNYPEIGQVKPGQSFPYLMAQSDWYQIKVELTATSSGWISTQYAQLHE